MQLFYQIGFDPIKLKEYIYIYISISVIQNLYATYKINVYFLKISSKNLKFYHSIECCIWNSNYQFFLIILKFSRGQLFKIF